MVFDHQHESIPTGDVSPASVRQPSVVGMTTIEIGDVREGRRFGRVVREWWPVPVFIAGAVVAQVLLLTSRYHVGGHAAEHVGSASAPFLAAAMLAILFWATPGARRQVDVILSAAAWLAATVVVMVGNVRVVDDLLDAGHGHTPTSVVPTSPITRWRTRPSGTRWLPRWSSWRQHVGDATSATLPPSVRAQR